MENTKVKIKDIESYDSKLLYSQLKHMSVDFFNKDICLNNLGESDFISFDNFIKWLNLIIDNSKGINLKKGFVPSTIYFIEYNNKIVGRISLRHNLNEHLRVDGGHVGIIIFESKNKNKGIGTVAMRLAVSKLKNMGIENALVTVKKDNFASQKMVQKIGGVLQTSNNIVKDQELLYYLIKTVP